jgi:hypothetical protein
MEGTINHLRGGYRYLPVKHDDGTWQLRRAHCVAWEIAHGQSVPAGRAARRGSAGSERPVE